MLMTGKQITLLLDYRRTLWSSVRRMRTDFSLDVNAVLGSFLDRGYQVHVMEFSELDLRSSYNDSIFIYQSSEDSGLLYKGFIEDWIYALQLQGAVVIPEYKYLLAHHNKCFMELLRDLTPNSNVQSTKARCFGTYEEIAKADLTYPVVLKPSAGARGTGVCVANNRTELLRKAKILMRSFSLFELANELRKRILLKRYVIRSLHRRKLIAQDFFSGLSNDFKVLCYWDRYYILKRSVRRGDFRASGSGKFGWITQPPIELLEFADSIRWSLNVPCISMDIGMSNNRAVLFEMQFVSFGTLTLEKSEGYFIRKDSDWRFVQEKPNLEKTFVYSLIKHIEHNGF